MWSKETAKYLIDKGRESEDGLTKDLADYLGYALDTVEYLDDVIKERDEIIEGLKEKNNEE